MGKLIDKLSRLFFEEVEVETEYDEKTNKVQNKTTRVIQPEKKQEPVKVEKSEPKQEEKKEVKKSIVQQVQPEKKTNESNFLNVGKTTVQESKPVEKKEPVVYRSQGVISPIFGDGKNNFSTKPVSDDHKEENTRSIIGTVFSPMFGDGRNNETDPKEKVDEKIASMTIDDFISPEVEEKKKTQKAPMTKKEMASFNYKPLEEGIKEQPDTENKTEIVSEKKSEGLTIENLSLFD